MRIRQLTVLILSALGTTTTSFTLTPRTKSHFLPTDKSTFLRQAPANIGEATELPDSLEDAAEIAALACSQFTKFSPQPSRCRIDFDTSVGDETYTTLKSSTEFMQKFVTGLCYELIPGVMDQLMSEKVAVVKARNELKDLVMSGSGSGDDKETEEGSSSSSNTEERKAELAAVIENGGRDPTAAYTGPKARIYFPDEGSAALARRDWTARDPSTGESLVPPCVEFSSLGGVQVADVSNDTLVFYFCPRASEADFVEETLYKAETSEGLILSVFVNPLLVDMGVTGYGMAGRMLRERLIEPLDYVYYLRTLPWGALTRTWPRDYTVWQEDAEVEGGYRMIKRLDTLPSNPEVVDIYDVANGLQQENKEGTGILNAFGDFVNGMTRL